MVKGLCKALMFGLKYKVNLTTIKDNVANTKASFSFIQHPNNQLSKVYLNLAAKAFVNSCHSLSRNSG